jgi:hypothetical protein
MSDYQETIWRVRISDVWKAKVNDLFHFCGSHDGNYDRAVAILNAIRDFEQSDDPSAYVENIELMIQDFETIAQSKFESHHTLANIVYSRSAWREGGI